MNIFLRFLGVGLVLMGLALFFLSFWVFAPAVATLIPKGEWKGFLDVLVYLVIAWIGGIGVPVAFIFTWYFLRPSPCRLLGRDV